MHTPKTTRTRWSGLVCVLYARLIWTCVTVRHGVYFKTLRGKKCKVYFDALCTMPDYTLPSARRNTKDFVDCLFVKDNHMNTTIRLRSQRNISFCCSHQHFLVMHKSPGSLRVEKNGYLDDKNVLWWLTVICITKPVKCTLFWSLWWNKTMQPIVRSTGRIHSTRTLCGASKQRSPANQSRGREELRTCIRGLGWPPSTAALIQN